MVWLGRLTGLCALCLVLVNRTGAVSAADPPPERAVLSTIAAQPLSQALAAYQNTSSPSTALDPMSIVSDTISQSMAN